MSLEWDAGKNQANFTKHGLWFDNIDWFDAEPFVLVDGRRDYGGGQRAE